VAHGKTLEVARYQGFPAWYGTVCKTWYTGSTPVGALGLVPSAWPWLNIRYRNTPAARAQRGSKPTSDANADTPSRTLKLAA
jgi:hypothetical protein